jgi:putative membrane protein insertion efficiency factor
LVSATKRKRDEAYAYGRNGPISREDQWVLVRKLGGLFLGSSTIRLNKRKYLFSIAFLIYLSKFSVILADDNAPEWGPWSASPSSPVVEESVVKNIIVNDADTNFSSTKLPFIWALKFYRKFISPVSGKRCQMYPSCSHYSLLAFKKHGPLLGTIMTADRLMRCNPSCRKFHPLVYQDEGYHCYDPVEDNEWFKSQKGKFLRVIREIRGSNSNPPEAAQ